MLTESPTYLGALQAFNAYEPVYGSLSGLSNTAPVHAFENGPRPCLGYAMPDFRNPTGTSLSLDQRLRLLDMAHALELPLVEDAAYEALRYEGTPLPSLLALECQRVGLEEGLVIYCGTFSKIVVPGLRLGWVVAPRAVIRKLVLIKQGADLHTSSINQMVMHDVASRDLPARIETIRTAYRTRRDAMLAALSRHMPAGAAWSHPEGGMFIWVTLPDNFDTTEIFARSVSEAHVAFVPGQAFFTDGTGRNTMRLNFTLADPATIESGIERLCRVLS